MSSLVMVAAGGRPSRPGNPTLPRVFGKAGDVGINPPQRNWFYQHRVGWLMKTGVAVEKLDLSENRPKRSDQKCIGDRRKSFIGHPDATHFRRKFCERVFQQLQAITLTTQGFRKASPAGTFLTD